MLATDQLTNAVKAAHGAALRATIVAELRTLATDAAAQHTAMAAEAAPDLAQGQPPDRQRRGQKVQDRAKGYAAGAALFDLLANHIEAGRPIGDAVALLGQVGANVRGKPDSVAQADWDAYDAAAADAGTGKRVARSLGLQARTVLSSISLFM